MLIRDCLEADPDEWTLFRGKFHGSFPSLHLATAKLQEEGWSSTEVKDIESLLVKGDSRRKSKALDVASDEKQDERSSLTVVQTDETSETSQVGKKQHSLKSKLVCW